MYRRKTLTGSPDPTRATGRIKPCINYRPQRSWAKVIFSQACVKNSVHGGGGCVSASVHAGIHPPRSSPSPPGRQTTAYGQRAAGTHPTGMHSYCRTILEVTHNIANALSTPTRNVRFLHSAFDATGDGFVASDYQGNIFKFDINRNR